MSFPRFTDNAIIKINDEVIGHRQRHKNEVKKKTQFIVK